MGIRRKLYFAGMLLFVIMTLAVAGYRIIGGPGVSMLDAVYMAVTTFATVGYGEIIDTSHSPALRMFNTFVIVCGWLAMIYIVSSVTAFLVEGEITDIFRRRKMQNLINQLKYHYIVCGLGDTGRHAVEELEKTHTPYVVVESHEDNIRKFRDPLGTGSDAFEKMLYVIGDATDDAVLDQAGLKRAKGIIAGLANDKDNLVITVMVRQQNEHVRIVSRCSDPKYAERMTKAGANSTVSPNHIGGMRMASEVLRPHVVSFLDLMLKEQSKTLRLEEIDIGKSSPWVGKSIQELAIKNRFGVLVLAVKSAVEVRGARFHVNPPPDHRIVSGEIIIVMGDVKEIKKARLEAQHDEAFMLAAQD
jgi:voltage-gated potassium channel